MTSFNTDVKPFLLDAMTRGSGFGTTSWYLTSMQMGFEPWNGGVGLAVNSFSATVSSGATGFVGTWKIVNKNSGKALDVYNNGTGDGADVVQWTWNGGNNQQWQIITTTSPYVKIINRNSGKALDVYNNGTGDGANVIQWTWNGGNNQQWQLLAP
jgi:endoglucanase